MRPHGRHAIVAPQNPEAFAQCDRCGEWWNRSQLMWQMQWSGTHLYSLGILVCPRCIDVPQEQLRTIILPPDPPPVINARPPNFAFEEEGPVQSTLTEIVLTGSTFLPVQSVEGFALDNVIWIQLSNATFQQVIIIGIDTNLNVLEISAPLTAVAPTYGSVTVSDTQVGISLTPAGATTCNGTGSLSVFTTLNAATGGDFSGSGSLSVFAGIGGQIGATFGGTGSLVVSTTNFGLGGFATFGGAGSLSAFLSKFIGANFNGTGSLSIVAQQANAGLVTFNGSGSLIGNYLLGYSLIFTSASTQNLSTTGKTATNAQKFTFAAWFKTTQSGVQGCFLQLGSSNGGVGYTEIFINSTLQWNFTVSGVQIGGGTTTSSYNDGNWHHVVLAVDTTQATSTNRSLLYVDGSLATLAGGAQYPAQNTNLVNNLASTVTIGALIVGADYYNGKMAQVYYIDGQQLTPSSFITGTPGAPKTYSGTYAGVFDFFLPFSNGISTTTLGADSSGEGNNWTLNNMTTANQSTDYP